ncbi:hypothetical protein AWC05_18755 [Mycobacterium florentinum]|uniref:DUF7802 domain-containing protein n=1 Tax=Mycobacterium florentinum TaxID=292462 RepID=A0A1X1UCU9_MYCFL|nr:hypothetical protein [Mycobacterium florentinum]MCV7412664.1 hypothetical protein [Mycobacterium florentinum]ORV54621.1 hypothetical protein AWC05_18755 [Mycobacterium florentinum]BBX82048.1 hypothetical protein MFLOJ_58350 [Mycobacterium florentinum]
MSQCNARFNEIAATLGHFTCTDAPAVIHIRNPFALSNPTMPVLELMMVGGAGLALWWAIRRLRRHNDPTNLVLWFASIVYLLVTEIPLYFPNLFMVEDQIGVVFDHNVFTVQFLYERLPLYIVALYPAVTTLAFEIVRTLGVFRSRGILAGSLCVGLVHQCFYEVFDQLGPQLRWWAWNTENPLNRPMFASVPMTSVYIFATLGPAVLTLLVMLLVGRKVANGTRMSAASLLWRTVAAGLLVTVGLALLSIPSSIFGGSHPNTTAQAVVFVVELAAFAVFAIPALIGARRRGEADDKPNRFVRIFGSIYLGVLGILWLTALPEYFAAKGGITGHGTPTGNLLYAVLCFTLAVLWVALAGTATVSRDVATTNLRQPA